MDEFTQAGEMMKKLIELLNIPSSKEIQFVTLREELRLIDDYVAIMNCRTAKTIEVIYNLETDAEEESIPRMILQPIVGNSIFHGFADKYEDCRIEITARREAEYLIIEICDNGEGITEERLRKIKNDEMVQPGKTHHGVGLNNIKKRIEIIYGIGSSMEIESTFGEGTRVTLYLNDRKG